MTYSTITVNSGHSAKATGAFGNGYFEHIVARQFKDKLIVALNKVGQKTVDTTSDESTPNKVLQGQVAKCNAIDASGRLDVSIHLNAGGGTGVEVLYYDQFSLADKVSSAIANVTGLRNRGAKQRKELYFLKNTNAPSILIELCFIDNADDMRILISKFDEIVNVVAEVLSGIIITETVTKKEEQPVEDKSFTPSVQALRDSVNIVLQRFEDKDPALSEQWRNAYNAGTLSESDAIGILFHAIRQGWITGQLK